MKASKGTEMNKNVSYKFVFNILSCVVSGCVLSARSGCARWAISLGVVAPPFLILRPCL